MAVGDDFLFIPSKDFRLGRIEELKNPFFLPLFTSPLSVAFDPPLEASILMFFSCCLLPRLLNTDEIIILRFLQNVFFAGLTVFFAPLTTKKFKRKGLLFSRNNRRNRRGPRYRERHISYSLLFRTRTSTSTSLVLYRVSVCMSHSAL